MVHNRSSGARSFGEDALRRIRFRRSLPRRPCYFANEACPTRPGLTYACRACLERADGPLDEDEARLEEQLLATESVLGPGAATR